MKTINKYLALAIAMVAALASCSNDEEMSNSSGVEIIEIPTVSEITINKTESAISNHLNKFGMDLFSAVLSGNDRYHSNVSVSPLSMAICLGLAANAHDDDYKNAVIKTMGCKDIPELNVYLNKLLRYLPDKANGCETSFANSVWHISSCSPSSSFVDISKNIYYAPINKYKEDERFEVADRINLWCNLSTRGMIPGLLSKHEGASIDMIILNAMYFSGKWETSFDRDKTSKQMFHGANGDKTVDMMSGEFARLSYRYSPKGLVVYLPYKGDYYMTLILPAEDVAVKDIADALLLGLPEQEVKQGEWISSRAVANIAMPKFKVSCTMVLNEIMEDMGFPCNGFVPEFNLDAPHITYRQKTVVEVDEEGTRAAAVSASIVDSTPINIVFDKPFLYSIVNKTTGLSLITGYVGDPTVSE